MGSARPLCLSPEWLYHGGAAPAGVTPFCRAANRPQALEFGTRSACAQPWSELQPGATPARRRVRAAVRITQSPGPRPAGLWQLHAHTVRPTEVRSPQIFLERTLHLRRANMPEMGTTVRKPVVLTVIGVLQVLCPLRWVKPRFPQVTQGQGARRVGPGLVESHGPEL